MIATLFYGPSHSGNQAKEVPFPMVEGKANILAETHCFLKLLLRINTLSLPVIFHWPKSHGWLRKWGGKVNFVLLYREEELCSVIEKRIAGNINTIYHNVRRVTLLKINCKPKLYPHPLILYSWLRWVCNSGSGGYQLWVWEGAYQKI